MNGTPGPLHGEQTESRYEEKRTQLGECPNQEKNTNDLDPNLLCPANVFKSDPQFFVAFLMSVAQLTVSEWFLGPHPSQPGLSST